MSRRRKPLPENPVIVTIEKLSHEGRGIATINGKTTFIRGALPGEEVEFKYTYCSGRYDEGKVLSVLTASPERVTPECPHTDMCGGCSLQHMDMSAQIQFKQDTLINQMKHFGKVEPEEILPVLTADEYGYRRKARLGVRYVTKKERVLVGFREVNGRYLADIDACVVLHPKIGLLITPLSDLIRSLSCFDQIAQIEVAMGDEDAALIFRHLAPLTSEDIKKLHEFGEKHQIHVYGQPNKPNPMYCLWPENTLHFLHYRLNSHDINIKFHPADFTQVNFPINNLMVNRAIELLALSPEDSVLDLFCGIGNFTLPIARYAGKVVGIEGAQEAIDRANDNASNNNITNTEFYCHDLFKDCSEASWAKTSFNKALLDPPRSGAENIIPLLPKLGINHIVYVSCNPATLARDAGTLVHEHGFTLKSAGIMNMFPHTNHVESIALFIKE
jgi:23S rRNA (uracil1939-C5)-methyltransferase